MLGRCLTRCRAQSSEEAPGGWTAMLCGCWGIVVRLKGFLVPGDCAFFPYLQKQQKAYGLFSSQNRPVVLCRPRCCSGAQSPVAADVFSVSRACSAGGGKSCQHFPTGLGTSAGTLVAFADPNGRVTRICVLGPEWPRPLRACPTPTRCWHAG